MPTRQAICQGGSMGYYGSRSAVIVARRRNGRGLTGCVLICGLPSMCSRSGSVPPCSNGDKPFPSGSTS